VPIWRKTKIEASPAVDAGRGSPMKVDKSAYAVQKRRGCRNKMCLIRLRKRAPGGGVRGNAKK